ncbi:transmembrane 4 L6 family member 4-like [Dromiciops gliroides]|uniref:transmembrane 4 L6 family member 4-like n=1 Tax=Dromiciops gliroides TaxID=33562 RepID=UPI001CC7FB5C|nr:transmembrane 4 L6 family member 4-like [Dromiciops gliroides]
MCSTDCTHCLGATLLHMALISMLLNILLFFPGMQRVSAEKIPDEAWKLGGLMGSGVLILFPASVYLQLRHFNCWGCFNHPACGRSLSSMNAVIFSCVGILGSSYGLFMALFAIYRGPKCFVGGDKWEYPFHKGNYLVDLKYWKDCKSPAHIVPWHLSIFITQSLLSVSEFVICTFELISGLLGTVFVSEKCPWAHKDQPPPTPPSPSPLPLEAGSGVGRRLLPSLLPPAGNPPAPQLQVPLCPAYPASTLH